MNYLVTVIDKLLNSYERSTMAIDQKLVDDVLACMEILKKLSVVKSRI